MVALVKFIYTFILPPGIFVIVLFITGFVAQRFSRRLGVCLLVTGMLFYALCTPYVGGLLMHTLENKYPALPDIADCDAIVVIGYGAVAGRCDVDGQFGILSATTNARVTAAARLARATGLPIVVSGGSVYETSGNEADISSRYLVSMGIHPDKIIKENESRTTKENALYTKKVLDSYSFSRPVLVASAFHLPRAVLEFERVGIRVVPYPVDWRTTQVLERHINMFVPTYDGLWQTGTVLREWLGMMVLQLR